MFGGLLVSVKLTAPPGVETGPLSVSVTVTVNGADPPIGAVAVSGLMEVEVARVLTVRLAVLLVVPGPLSVALTAPVVLFFSPVLVPVTYSEMVQEPPAAIVPPLKLAE